MREKKEKKKKKKMRKGEDLSMYEEEEKEEEKNGGPSAPRDEVDSILEMPLVGSLRSSAEADNADGESNVIRPISVEIIPPRGAAPLRSGSFIVADAATEELVRILQHILLGGR